MSNTDPEPQRPNPVAEWDEPFTPISMGSKSDAVNIVLGSQVAASAWVGNTPKQSLMTADDPSVVAGLVLANLKPQNEVEGMLIAQMIACHNASMECFRRAMLPEQSMQARDFNLPQANKLTRSYATLLQTLDKHRGKGQQTVRVEHVHVHDGGQAIIGAVATSEGRLGQMPVEAPKAIGHLADKPVEWACETFLPDRVLTGEGAAE